MAEVERNCKYTSVDGSITHTSASKCMGMVKIAGGILLLALVFLCGTTQDSFLRIPSGATASIRSNSATSTDLPEDFKGSELQVAVSEDGKAFLVALPAKRQYGVYQMTEIEDGTWETSLLEEGHRSIRRLFFAKNPEYGTVSSFWADRGLWGFDTANAVSKPKKGHGPHPVTGQSPFPSFDFWEDRQGYDYFPKIAISDEATPRIAVLSLDPDMTLKVYAKMSTAVRIYEPQGQIHCTDFGPQECLGENEYDDDGSVLSYEWLGNDTVAVDMCTMGRCSIHLFREESETSSWRPTVNFTRPPKGYVVFTSRDDQQKMIQTELGYSREDHQPKNMTIRTWTNQDHWTIPSNQTIPFPKYELLDHHYLSISRKPLLSKDGSVLCITLIDTYQERPIVIDVPTLAWIYHWDSSADQWNLYRTVELGQDVLQVELSGNGQRLVLFQKDYSFSVKDL